MKPGSRRRATGGAACALILLLAIAAGASGDLDRARDLYNAARYEDALQALGAMTSEEQKTEGAQVTAYTALCLLALGRTADAETVVARRLDDDPDYRPQPADLSPRLALLVDRVRHDRFPALVRAQYEAGKASFAADHRAEASTHFARVVSMAAGQDAQLQGAVAELVTLAKEYLTLIDAASAPKPAPAVPTAVTGGPPAGPDAKGPAGRVTGPPAVSAANRSADAAARVFTAEDPGVVAPRVRRQDVPRWASAFGPLPAAARRATLEIVIDRKGRVETARLDQPLHPLYDGLLLAAARQWTYDPATRNGSPVRFRKLIAIVLQP